MIYKLWNIQSSKIIVETESFQDTINSHIQIGAKCMRQLVKMGIVKSPDARRIKKIRLIGHSIGGSLSRLLVFGGISG